MDVICPQCGTTYELDESQIQGKSVRVKCSACEYMFRVYRPTPSQIIPALQTWIVRSSDGVVSHVPDQSTLQRMIVERKVGRSDELSRDGRAWQLLGDVHDFRPFFAIVEEALNSSTMLQAVTGSGVAFNAVHATTPEVVGIPGLMGVQPSMGLGPTGSGPVLLAGDMDPSSTLEFGLPGFSSEPAKTDVGIKAVSEEATAVAYGKSSADPATLQVPVVNEATEIALEGIAPSEAELIKASGVPVSLVPVSEGDDDDTIKPTILPGVASNEEDEETPSLPTPPASDGALAKVGGTGSQEMSVRVSPPTSTSFEGDALVSREPHDDFDLAPENDEDWFEGSSSSLDDGDTSISQPEPSTPQSFAEFDDEPPDANGSMSLNSGMRDFSSYTGEYYSQDSQDDFAMPQPSRKGLWILLSVFGVALIAGGFIVLLPDLTARISVSLGLSETTPAAMKKVDEAQKLLGSFTLEGCTKAQNLLTEAEQLHGGSFPSSLAGRIEVELTRTEYRLFEMDLARKQRIFWEKKRKEIDASIAKIPADDADKVTKIAILMRKKRAYQAQIDTYEKQRTDALAQYKKHWQAASRYRTPAQEKAPGHQAVELSELHLYSLSAAADKKFQPLYRKILLKSGPNAAAVQTRLFLMSAWVSLHQKQYSQSLDRVRKVIADQAKWVYPRLLQARAWAASERRDDANSSLESLLKFAPKHSLALANMRYLKQVSAAAIAPRPVAAVAPKPGTPATTPANPGPAGRVVKRAPAKRTSSKAAAGGGSYRSLMRQADRLRRNERYKSARRYYRRALKIKKSSRAYSGLGWCTLESSGPKTAISLFKKAMRMSGRNADAYFGLGMAYRRQRNTAKARSVLKQYLARFSRHRDAGEVRMILKSLR